MTTGNQKSSFNLDLIRDVDPREFLSVIDQDITDWKKERARLELRIYINKRNGLDTEGYVVALEGVEGSLRELELVRSDVGGMISV